MVRMGIALKISAAGLFHRTRPRAVFIFVALLLFPACRASALAPRTEAVKIIGPAGGEVRVTDPASPVFGTVVVVPPGALNRDVPVSIELENTLPFVRSGKPWGVCPRLRAGDVSEFLEPVDIHCRYNPDERRGSFAIGYAVDGEGRLSPLQMTGENRDEGAVSLSTFVPAAFTLVFVEIPH